MSGYNMEYFISDFAKRTKANLGLIDQIAELKSSDSKAYEVTQLINSFLGLVVLPNEKFKKWEKKKSLEMKAIEEQIWQIIKNCEDENRYFNSFKDRKSGKVLEFVKHIRNAISHSGNLGLHFYPLVEGGDNNITHIMFYDSDYGIIRNKQNAEVAHKKAKEFCLKLTIKEAKRMATYIADLYTLVEKTPGEDKNYQETINALNNLLSDGETAFEGTVAERFEKKT